jgi:cysteine dioxygenase
MAKNLDELIGYLDKLDGRAALDALVAELADLDIDVDEVADHVRYDDRTYRRNLVHAGPWYNVWVLCWKNGQRSPIHDHKGSSCVIRVLEGTMTETLFEVAGNGQIKANFSRDLPEGGVVGSEDADIHQVSNLQAGGVPLITLHVYSPPLAVMGTYSLLDDSRGTEPMFLEFYDAAGI